MVAWRKNKKQENISQNGHLKTIPDLAKSFVPDYNSLKGHIAEFFIKQLFRHKLKLPIEETGVEHTRSMATFLAAQGQIPYRTVEDDRKSQDFCAYLPDRDNRTKYPLIPVYIEVKFRDRSRIKVSELKEYKKYRNSKVVFALIDKEGMYCIDRDEIDKKRSGTEKASTGMNMFSLKIASPSPNTQR